MNKSHEQIEQDIQEQLIILRQLSQGGELIEEIDIPDITEHTGYPDDLMIY